VWGGGDIVREHVCMSVCTYARVGRVRIGCAAARCRSGCMSLGQVRKSQIWRDLLRDSNRGFTQMGDLHQTPLHKLPGELSHAPHTHTLLSRARSHFHSTFSLLFLPFSSTSIWTLSSLNMKYRFCHTNFLFIIRKTSFDGELFWYWSI